MNSEPRFSARAQQLAGRYLTTLAVGLAIVLAASGCATATGEAKADPDPSLRVPAASVEDTWGIEVVGLRLTAAGHMLDFRYKVVDAEKAAPLFVRANQPELVLTSSGARLPVYSPAKTGPLRSTNPPLEGRVYFMFFPNPGFVRAGDQATLEIGDFRAYLVVE